MQITQQAREIAAKYIGGGGYIPKKSVLEGEHDDKPFVRIAQAALDTTGRTPMTEDEILQRARRACADQSMAHPGLVPTLDEFLRGVCDKGMSMLCVMTALRNLDKPVVDSVVLVCREILAKDAEASGIKENANVFRSGFFDDGTAMRQTVAGYRAGLAAQTNA